MNPEALERLLTKVQNGHPVRGDGDRAAPHVAL